MLAGEVFFRRALGNGSGGACDVASFDRVGPPRTESNCGLNSVRGLTLSGGRPVRSRLVALRFLLGSFSGVCRGVFFSRVLWLGGCSCLSWFTN